MVLENYEIALIGIAGILVGALLNNRLTLIRDDISERRQANRNLIKVFTSELSDVYPTAVNFPERIDPYLRSKFSTLQAAIAEFRLHLPHTELESLDQTWFEYYCSTQRDIDKDCQSYTHYTDYNGQDGHANLVSNINKILAYAKKT
jgi:hypothetical protein